MQHRNASAITTSHACLSYTRCLPVAVLRFIKKDSLALSRRRTECVECDVNVRIFIFLSSSFAHTLVPRVRHYGTTHHQCRTNAVGTYIRTLYIRLVRVSVVPFNQSAITYLRNTKWNTVVSHFVRSTPIGNFFRANLVFFSFIFVCVWIFWKRMRARYVWKISITFIRNTYMCVRFFQCVLVWAWIDVGFVDCVSQMERETMSERVKLNALDTPSVAICIFYLELLIAEFVNILFNFHRSNF